MGCLVVLVLKKRCVVLMVVDWWSINIERGGLFCGSSVFKKNKNKEIGQLEDLAILKTERVG